LASVGGASVVFVARPAVAEAIKRGITIRRESGDVLVRGNAGTSIEQIEPSAGDVILLTVKSQHSPEAIADLARAYPKETPIVCLQNAVSNESVAAERFDRVYAGLVLMTTVQLKPDLITMSQGNTIAVGLYPEGCDSLAEKLCEDLSNGGFEAIASSHVMAMKWGKLIANLNNATHAITDYWLERSHEDPEMRLLMACVREEGLRVLDAAGIAAEPPEGERSPLRIRKSTEEMKRPFERPSGDTTPGSELPYEQRAYASMWQDLYHGRDSNEADMLNGEIVRLGKRFEIPTPYNSTLLEVMDRMTAERLKPGLYTPSELHALINTRARLAKY
jgi:2-dehydropantoate 2-reductase